MSFILFLDLDLRKRTYIIINKFNLILCFVDSCWVSLTIDHQLWGNFDIN